MMICYARSSSLGTLEMCEQKYFLSYIVGLRDKSNLKASLGSILHKAMELLALKSKAISDGYKSVISDDFGELTFEQCDDIPYITRLAFDFYKAAETTLTFTETEYDKCLEWVNKAIAYDNGALDPRNQKVFDVEIFFDLEIKEDWAKYEYKIGKHKIAGNLSIKGTIDLVLNENDTHFHILDYKSGKRYNWGKEKEKTYGCLEKDDQLLLYYYALKNLYPDKEFYVSIFYVNDGGLFTFAFDEADYKRAESMIKQKFQYIKSVEFPKLISQDNSHFKCKHMCAFSKPFDMSGKSICHHFRDEIKKKGIDKVTAEYANLSRIKTYGDGGGRLK